MAHFEYSKFDGSEQFTPQSADAVFDELTRHMLDWGDDVLDYLDQWEEQHPDVVDMLIKRGYIEKDSEGKYYVTPKGIRRVESKALEELFQIARKDKLGKHDPLRQIRAGEESGDGPAIARPQPLPGRLFAGRRLLYVRQPSHGATT